MKVTMIGAAINLREWGMLYVIVTYAIIEGTVGFFYGLEAASYLGILLLPAQLLLLMGLAFLLDHLALKPFNKTKEYNENENKEEL